MNYFGAEQFKAMTAIDVTVVTYRGTGPLTNDLVGGHVMVAFNTLPPAIGNTHAGNSRPSRWRRPNGWQPIADVPTTGEAGMPALRCRAVLRAGRTGRYAAPDRRAAQQGAAYHCDFRRFKERIVAAGGGPAPSTPEEYAANIVREEGKWSAMIRKLGLKLE